MDRTRIPGKALGFKFKFKQKKPTVQLRTRGFIYTLEGSNKIRTAGTKLKGRTVGRKE
jgi:hypothetical protein